MAKGNFRRAEIRIWREGYLDPVTIESPLANPRQFGLFRRLGVIFGWNVLFRGALYIMFGRQGWRYNLGGKNEEDEQNVE